MAEREDSPIEGLDLCGDGIINGVKTAEPCQGRKVGCQGRRGRGIDGDGKGKG